MGNCVERYGMRPTEMMKQQQHEEERKRSSGGLVKKIIDTRNKEGDNINGESQRMKIVVTKEELKWLIFELNEKGGGGGGGMRMEQVLEEIEKGRSEKVVLIERWKPSLETIVEASSSNSSFRSMDRSN